MIFGAKNLYTTNEILDSLLKTGDIKDATGAVSITKKDGRKTVASGKIFFRNELIYAVEIANHEIPIGKRVESGGLVDQDDLDGIFRRLGSKTSPQIVDQLLVSQLISEKNINNYVKEHFIETLSEILSWDNSTGEWHPNVTTKDFVMPYVALDKIRAILANRASFRKEFAIAVRSFFKDDEIAHLTFVSNIKDASDYPAEIRAILRRADGEFTVDSIARDTGISHFAVFQSVISLWKKNLLTIRLGGIDLPFASLQEAIHPTPVEEIKPAEDSLVPLASESDPNAEPEVDPEEESIKSAVAVTENFVNNTHDYADDVSEDEESSGETDSEEEPEVVSEEFVESESKDEIVNDDTLEISDSSAEDVASDASDDFIVLTDEEVEENPVDDSDDFITLEDGAEEEPLPDFIEDAAEEQEEAPIELHFGNLPKPYSPPVEVFTEPEPQKEAPLPIPSNVNDANQTIASFTSQLNALQGELSAIATTITAAKTKLDEHEDNVSSAEAKVQEAKRELEKAENNLLTVKAGNEGLHTEVANSEAKYAETVKQIESLIQSFKFSG